jgi:hypothetical protein
LYSNNDYESIKGESDESDNEGEDRNSSRDNDNYTSDSNDCETKSFASSTTKTVTSHSTISAISTISSTIAFSITKEQLQNVLLKKTDKPNTNERAVLLRKNDLIEELKMAKDLEGIKKVKEQTKNKHEVNEILVKVFVHKMLKFVEKFVGKRKNC